MISSKRAAFAVAAAAFAATGCVQAPAPQAAMKVADADHMMVQSCMSMSHEDMMKSSDCTSMMSSMKMSEADMSAMMACHKMPHADMMKDERCMSMMRMHSSMMGMKSPS
ncbi:MAG: hypothetical protein ABL956_00710 [Hyphomonadaceae bacterium]